MGANASEQTTKFAVGLTTSSWPPSDYYISLHVSASGTNGAGEVTGGSYARQAITWVWDASDQRAENNNQLDYPAMPTGTIVAVGVWDAVSSGNFLFGGNLNVSKTLVAGDSVRFTVGNLTFKFV